MPGSNTGGATKTFFIGLNYLLSRAACGGAERVSKLIEWKGFWIVFFKSFIQHSCKEVADPNTTILKTKYFNPQLLVS